MGPDAMILLFWMLSWVLSQLFDSPLSPSLRGSSSSSLSAIRVVSSAYLKLLIFLPAILIPACASSSPIFLLMYSVYKLNKQGDNIQPWCTPFPIWNQSVVLCPVLTVASWPAYEFLRRQVRWSGIPISSRIFHSDYMKECNGSEGQLWLCASRISKEACVVRVELRRTTVVEPKVRETPGLIVIQGLVGGGDHVRREWYELSYTLHCVYLIHWKEARTEAGRLVRNLLH